MHYFPAISGTKSNHKPRVKKQERNEWYGQSMIFVAEIFSTRIFSFWSQRERRRSRANSEKICRCKWGVGWDWRWYITDNIHCVRRESNFYSITFTLYLIWTFRIRFLWFLCKILLWIDSRLLSPSVLHLYLQKSPNPTLSNLPSFCLQLYFYPTIFSLIIWLLNKT